MVGTKRSLNYETPSSSKDLDNLCQQYCVRTLDESQSVWALFQRFFNLRFYDYKKPIF